MNNDEKENRQDRFERFKNETMDQGLLERLEKQKAELKKTQENIYTHPTVIKYVVIAGIVGIGVLFLPIHSAFIYGYFIVAGAIIFIGVPTGIMGKLKAGYRKSFKEEMVGGLIPYFDEKLEYEPFDGVEQEKVNDPPIFPLEAKTFHGEDHITGTYQDVEIELSEILFSHGQTHDMGSISFSQEQKDRMPVMKRYAMDRQVAEKTADYIGLFFIADFHKEFSFTTVMRPNEFEWRLPEWGGDRRDRFMGGEERVPEQYNPTARLEDPEGGTELQEVNLDDPELENSYDIYSNDPTTAFYIFSPSLMERVKTLQKEWDQKVFMGFKGSKMYLSIPFYDGVFEPHVGAEEGVEDQLREIFNDLDAVFGIVDDLKLNERIWKKE